jgi:hypothetical protein
LPDLAVQFIDGVVMLLFGFLPLVKQLGSALNQFPFPVGDHGRVDFIFGGKLGGALLVFQAASATFALNSGLYCFRFLIMKSSFQDDDSELSTLSSFWGPPQQTGQDIQIPGLVGQASIDAQYNRGKRVDPAMLDGTQMPEGPSNLDKVAQQTPQEAYDIRISEGVLTIKPTQ